MKSILQTKKVGLLLALISISASSLAQVPPFVTYQGVLQSGGQNFTGTGFFKFAIIDGVTQPSASPHFIPGGAMTGATVIDGGVGYVAPPAVSVSDPTGSGADLTAVLAGGSIVSITVNSGGAGYTDPTIHIAPPSENSSLWSNDGTAGGEPTTAVEVEVEKGLFTVVLGQDMTALNPSIFDHPGLYLRQWFSDDDQSSFVQWSEDIHLTSVPYAMIAAQVAGGAITGDQIADAAIGSSALAPDSVNSGHIIDGEVNTEDLADDAVTSGKLADTISVGSTAATGHLDVWDGVDDVQAIELNGSSHIVSVYGSDGLERIQLWGDNSGQIRLHDTEDANLTVWLTAGNDGLVMPQLLLSSSTEGGGARAQLLGGADGGSLSLLADDALRALLEANESDGGRLTLYQSDGQSGVALYCEDASGVGTLSLGNTDGNRRALLYGGSSGRMYLYNNSGTNTFEAHGGGSDGGQLILRRTDGQLGAVLYGEENPSGVGLLSLRNVAGNARARIYGGSSGRMYLYNDSGNTSTVVAHGGGTDGGRIGLSNNDGAETIVLRADHNGEGRITTEVLEITGGSDFSEQFAVSHGASQVEPGMVVSINPGSPGELVVSDQPYDRTVAGVVSGAGGVRPGMLMRQSGTIADGEHPVALSGRVYCNVDATESPIEPGDLITTSNTPGYGMKVTDHARALGAIIGKAMTGLDRGRGQILVLVSLQ